MSVAAQLEPDVRSHAGLPLVVSREPLAGPVIPRGAFTIPCPVPASAMPDKLSFVSHSLAPGFLLTFSDVDVLSVRDGRVLVFVGPADVVTWEPL